MDRPAATGPVFAVGCCDWASHRVVGAFSCVGGVGVARCGLWGRGELFGGGVGGGVVGGEEVGERGSG